VTWQDTSSTNISPHPDSATVTRAAHMSPEDSASDSPHSSRTFSKGGSIEDGVATRWLWTGHSSTRCGILPLPPGGMPTVPGIEIELIGSSMGSVERSQRLVAAIVAAIETWDRVDET
jgi:hypothetical protein